METDFLVTKLCFSLVTKFYLVTPARHAGNGGWRCAYPPYQNYQNQTCQVSKTWQVLSSLRRL